MSFTAGFEYLLLNHCFVENLNKVSTAQTVQKDFQYPNRSKFDFSLDTVLNITPKISRPDTSPIK